MEIKEFIEKKKQFESKLTDAISDIVADFEQETGLTPSFVMPTVEEVTAIGDEFKKYKVVQVVTEFDFL